MRWAGAWLTLACGLGGGVRLAGQEIPPVPGGPTAKDLQAAPSFGPDEHVVATHYFYWYDWPNEHFFDGPPSRGDDGLRQHFPAEREVSYKSAAWHRRQMEDLNAAGIDVALLVYWGTPVDYARPEVKFSVAGIPPLVEALDELAASGRPTPRIGMFFDTSTLQGHFAFKPPRTGGVDLRTDEGQDVFYRTIRDFFRLVPVRHWACLEGRPLVQLYESGFASGHDQSTVDYVYQQFARDFHGLRPFIVAGPAWSFQADASTGWGAALHGPIVRDGFAQIGPGYDDSPVPGRMTPTRDRLGGGFYAASWLLALEARPRLVIVETWSELHEGTAICETVEDGRLYIDLTRRFSDLLKRGQTPPAEEWARTVKALLSAKHSQPGGREFASRLTVGVRVDGDKLVEDGLRVCSTEDGLWGLGVVDGTACIQTRPGVGRLRYLYFDVADPYTYDQRGDLHVCVTYFDAGAGEIVVQYDSTAETGALLDRYREGGRVRLTDTRTWKTAALKLPGARCANGQNAGADFRLEAPGELAVRSVEARKLHADYGR
jgi:hypothetical protein